MIHVTGTTPLAWILPLVLAGVLALVATPVTIRLATSTGLIDAPVGTKIHTRPTPLLGGLAVYAALLVATITFLPLRGPVLGLLCGGGAAVCVGILDDKLSLPPLVHLAGQTVAAVIGIVTGIGAVRLISNPFASEAQIAHGQGNYTVGLALGFAVSVVWIVGMMNTVNFLDGLDGLSSGVGIITACLLAIWASRHPPFNQSELIVPVIFVGALAGFLFFNWSPAKIFIGDSGTLLMGLLLGGLSIIGPAKIGTALLILAIPILDVAWAIVRRRLAGRSFLAGDKQHVYHRMIELGMSPRLVVFSLYAICVSLALPDLFLARLDKLVVWGIVAVVTVAGFVLLEVVGGTKKELELPTGSPSPDRVRRG